MMAHNNCPTSFPELVSRIPASSLGGFRTSHVVTRQMTRIRTIYETLRFKRAADKRQHASSMSLYSVRASSTTVFLPPNSTIHRLNGVKTPQGGEKEARKAYASLVGPVARCGTDETNHFACECQPVGLFRLRIYHFVREDCSVFCAIGMVSTGKVRVSVVCPNGARVEGEVPLHAEEVVLAADRIGAQWVYGHTISSQSAVSALGQLR